MKLEVTLRSLCEPRTQLMLISRLQPESRKHRDFRDMIVYICADLICMCLDPDP